MTTVRQQQVRLSAEPKKRRTKHSPRQIASLVRPISNCGANVNRLHQMLQGNAVDTSLERSIQFVSVNPSDHIAASCAGKMTAGVKRKCTAGEKYILWLENGLRYESVYCDGDGFCAKKPALVSCPLTGTSR